MEPSGGVGTHRKDTRLGRPMLLQQKGIFGLPGDAGSILDANTSTQMAGGKSRSLMTSSDQIQYLIPITFSANRIKPLMVAVGVNDPGDLSPMTCCDILIASQVNIKLDPHLAWLAKTKYRTEACK
jgi:hypothetical protein